MEGVSHAFNVNEAVDYGVEKALLLQHIRFWCNQNKDRTTHNHDGKVWMYQSASDMSHHYPYWSRQKISRLLRDMESDGLVISGNFNATGYDQTKWYALSDKVQCLDVNIRDSKSEQPIPYTKPNTKTDNLFDDCWAMYGRKGNKQTALRYWKKLSTEDKYNIQDNILPYINSREYKYRKDFQGWINPANRMWEDEIINEERKVVEL
tara:strand:+ start:3226 stop:3846 length:621 start_codon:yes stop_codon:yes gene_type:complete